MPALVAVTVYLLRGHGVLAQEIGVGLEIIASVYFLATITVVKSECHPARVLALCVERYAVCNIFLSVYRCCACEKVVIVIKAWYLNAMSIFLSALAYLLMNAQKFFITSGLIAQPFS